MEQQGDVRLFQTLDDGDITVEGGITEMSGGLETAAYLSLFGGNEEDDGSADSPFQFWGNLSETQPEKKYRSETQHLLRALPAVTSNLIRVEDAAKRDLQWFLDPGVATSVTVVASIPGVNKVRFLVNIDADGEEIQIEFIENWKADL